MYPPSGPAEDWLELVLPGGWGSVTWTSLVQCGAVATGLEHETHLAREEVTQCPAYLLPDTAAGKRVAAEEAATRRQKYFGLPPNKRENYIKLGFQFPFSQPWSQLVHSLQQGSHHHCCLQQQSDQQQQQQPVGSGLTQEVLSQLGMASANGINTITQTSATTTSLATADVVCVIRDNRLLNALDYLMCPTGSRRRIFRDNRYCDYTLPKGNILKENVNPNICDKKIILDNDELLDTLNLIERTRDGFLVRVLITVIGSGTVEPCAIICLPTPCDFKIIELSIDDWGGNEDIYVDHNVIKRKEKRKQHIADLVSKSFLVL